jgi:hypothetical protein
MKMTCECGIKLRLVVKTEQEMVYIINDNGTLDEYDSRGGGQEFSLECGECDNVYEFEDEEGYFELQEKPMLYKWWFKNSKFSPDELIEQNLNKLKIVKK